MDIVPINGCVLVRLGEVYEYITPPSAKYGTKTSGTLIAVATDVPENIRDYLGKKVYFESYKDDTAKETDGYKYSLIKAEDLKGYVDAEPNA